MKNADVFVVRTLPFVLYIILGVNIHLSFIGVDMRDIYLLHSNSAIYASAMFIVSLSNKKYHCVYNRLMYVVLILTPTMNFLDFEFELFQPTQVQYISVLVAYYAILVITAVLAINHFKQAIQNKKKNVKPN